MAFALNRAQVIGNITADPEVRQIPSGRTVATFSVATNQTWTDASGQKQERAEFHNIVCWGKLAEIVSQYMRKGRKVYVEGRLQTRNWEGEDGVKRYKTEIIAENVIMLDRSPGGPGGEGAPISSTPRAVDSAPTSTPEPAAAAAAPAKESEEVTIDDLPF